MASSRYVRTLISGTVVNYGLLFAGLQFLTDSKASAIGEGFKYLLLHNSEDVLLRIIFLAVLDRVKICFQACSHTK